MEQRELEELTKLITEQVLAKLQGSVTAPGEEGRQKVLVVGKTDYVPENLRRDAILFSIEDYKQYQNILRYDAVYVTRLTLSQLADTALGRTETPETCALIHALLENVPVSMPEKALPHRKYAGKQNAALYHLYESYTQTLQIFGVRLLTERALPEEKPAVPPRYAKPPVEPALTHGIRNPERVVTETMALQMLGETEVHLRRDAIVTPAAQDVFRQHGIAVQKDGE